MRSVVGAVAAAVVVLATCATGCASEPDATRTITVFAAASLTQTFTELGDRFEAANPGTEVVFSFGASSALAEQLRQGAPADVFAAASPENMGQVVAAGRITATPVTFVRNRLQIAVPAGNPAGITGLADFGRPEPVLALCAEQVPCGAAARKVFDLAGITAQPDTREADVKAVLTKVTLGEVDAALVYRTDVAAAAERVEGIDFPESERVLNDYPIAPLAAAPEPATAAAFVDFVRSPQAREIFDRAGFAAP
ncbi:molybdate ABC transporter substrate-binding protein [Nocardia farcinica]|uniref:molybdate ABC transporter substrate-binding protein n=1 Tax=Nocardia farcinica TaxID=37329 RepID=UPI0018947EFB|nr:molybdate ABC transporter substrate-binding protein [Nocardia farcinica]MBF6230381.1 molybdate ABC transporter substrate-binding protein [Nocardia farcinica]